MLRKGLGVEIRYKIRVKKPQNISTWVRNIVQGKTLLRKVQALVAANSFSADINI